MHQLQQPQHQHWVTRFCCWRNSLLTLEVHCQLVHANITFFPFSEKQPTEQSPALYAIGLCLLHVHWKDADCWLLPLPKYICIPPQLIFLDQYEISSHRPRFDHIGVEQSISLIIFSILSWNSLSDPALSHPSFSRMQLLLQWYWLPPKVFPFWLYLCNCSFVKSQGWNGTKYPEIFPSTPVHPLTQAQVLHCSCLFQHITASCFCIRIIQSV